MNASDLIFHAITSRHSVSPKRLVEPGPSLVQIEQMIEAATCAPDHGLLRPWRFVSFGAEARPRLADVFEAALLERKADANEEERSRARAKAGRAPGLLGIIVRLDGDEAKQGNPFKERVICDDQYASAGAALQNILLMAHSMGFAARATSGRAVRTEAFRTALGLAENEQFLCFVAIGTPKGPGKSNPRPSSKELITHWQA